ncbi:hypothetical protein B0681_06705 [Moraxella porci DSM 25326]|uniref:Uncharacterized protein n=1 Tax=Moraxella porci DSM 25326 TaxID=573983 RepID=A0A1T0CR44_9GAMM|nr:hypothetical protein [Moraxella porci]OOS24812.1 hypothetical protein B0681_06705 [Moraxella porci DSM 25326]
MNSKNHFYDYQKLLRIRNRYIIINLFILMVLGLIDSIFETKLIFYMSFMAFCGFFYISTIVFINKYNICPYCKGPFFWFGEKQDAANPLTIFGNKCTNCGYPRKN